MSTAFPYGALRKRHNSIYIENFNTFFDDLVRSDDGENRNEDDRGENEAIKWRGADYVKDGDGDDVISGGSAVK